MLAALHQNNVSYIYWAAPTGAAQGRKNNFMYFKQQNLYLTILSIIFFALLIFINTTQAAELIFTEIMYNPEGADSNKEWVEIFNTSTSTIEINSDWRFNDGSNHLINIYQGNNQIASANFFIITNDGASFLNNYPDFSKIIFESSINLNNTADTIQLLKNSNIITQFSYTSELGGADNNKTIEKIDIYNLESSWQESYLIGGTPGEIPSSAPPNQAPVAIAGDDIQANINEEISFDASNSYDPDGDELNFLWNFNNQASSTSAIASYQFSEIGEYLITLTVDDGQLSSSDSLTLTLIENETNDPPQIIIENISDSFFVGELINFNACNSYDAENNLLNFNWSFGDSGEANGCQNNYRYNQSGNYTVSLIVSDSVNNSNWTKEIIINNDGINVIINELLPNPEGSDEAEWIELKNLSNNTINLENWYLADASGKKYIFSTDDFTNLNINDYFLIERSVSNISLNNSNESVYLFNNVNEKIDEMSYLQSQENYAWAYFDNQWELTSLLTPGAENKKENYLKPIAIIDLLSDKLTINKKIILSAKNSIDDNGQDLQYEWYLENFLKSENENLEIIFAEAGLKKIKLKVINESGLEDETIVYLNILEEDENGSTTDNEKITSECIDFNKEIIINEILPNPIGSDNEEWIELFNPNNTEINLNNWQIKDSGSTYILKEKISAQAYLLIKRADSKIALNNSNEQLQLLDCNGSLIWELIYEKSFEGQSYAYDEINEEYFWTAELSPAEKNILSFTENNFSKLNSLDEELYFAEMAEIFELENNQEIITYGIITALPDELYLNTAYLCSYDIHDETTYLDNCLGIYLNKDWPELNYGDIVQVQGKINHLKYYSRIKIENPENIIKINEKNMPNLEEYCLEELAEEIINSFISVSGKISKLNKKSFYISVADTELKIKINNEKIVLDELNKDDAVIIRGLLINYQDKLNLLPRNQDDIIKAEILGASETNITPSSTELINIDEEENKNPQALNWILGSGFLTSLGFVFKNKIIQLFRK